MKRLIKSAKIINENEVFIGSVLIDNEVIETIFKENDVIPSGNYQVIDAQGLWLIPGVIDDQVHFRDPGLTYKGDIFTESRAGVAGGVTSFMEMPNTKPQTVTIDLLEQKYVLGAEKAMANYSFYMGATNDNIDEIKKVDPKKVCGVKVFMGSSTGNMLVNNVDALNKIFAESPTIIATHSEDEEIIQANLKYYKEKFQDCIPLEYHPIIRSAEACYKSSAFAMELAKKYNSRLHILHLSTAKEMSLFDNTIPLKDKKITGEVCVHHLWFSDADYEKYGNRIKWNPAIKTGQDREALINAVNNNLLDVVATDHAPHTWEEKNKECYQAYSGGPMVQHSLVAMLEMAKEGKFTLEKVVEKMCHAPAELFRVKNRGFIRKGYFADLVLVDPNASFTVNKDNILYKCGWSPLEGTTFGHKIVKTFINGSLVYDNGVFDENFRGKRLEFEY